MLINEANSWCFLHLQVAPLALVSNLTTRRHHLQKLQIWQTDGPTWIDSKFGHLVAPFALFAKLATRLHYLHCHQMAPLTKLKIWQTDGPTWIGSKFGHLVTPFALFAKLATRSRPERLKQMFKKDGKRRRRGHQSFGTETASFPQTTSALQCYS